MSEPDIQKRCHYLRTALLRYWRLSSQSKTPLALCISPWGKVNTGSYKLNKYSMDKQAHAMCLAVKLPRVHNVLVYVVNLQS